MSGPTLVKRVALGLGLLGVALVGSSIGVNGIPFFGGVLMVTGFALWRRVRLVAWRAEVAR
ncbi:MAG: hypothetical protein ACO1ON_13070 [Nocardioides sp.]